MNWTKEQLEIINTRDKNIIVSAAAGSGKTAVLVERIKKLVLEERVPISNMLVVTFTNAAAAEMKEKIQKALMDEIENNPQDVQFLREQLDNLHNANISTFHAFGLEVIREHFYMVNVEADFKICDEAEGTIIKENVLNKLIEDSFQSGSEEFYDFLDAFGSDRNEAKIKNIILDTFTKLMSLPNPWEWLGKQIELLEKGHALDKGGMVMDYIEKDTIDEYNTAIAIAEVAVMVAESEGLSGIAQKLQGDFDSLKDFREDIVPFDYDKFKQHINSFSFCRLVATKAEKEAYEKIKPTLQEIRDKAKKALKGIREAYYGDNLEDMAGELASTAPRVKLLARLVKSFDNMYKEAKNDKKIIDFSDIEHYALDILDDEDIAEKYRDKFQYIFVDEYQDSNTVQDALIEKVRRENNLFLVGDVKQSIYKFRLAEPELFKARYDDFWSLESKQSTTIDLNMNFRSKSNVITCINKIFKANMDNYFEKEEMHVGDAYRGPLDFKPELHIVDDTVSDDDVDEELREMKKTQKEALVAASIIEDNLGSPIWDSKLGIERPLQMKDIVILMRGARNTADVFYNILEERNIPAFVDNNDGYLDTVEINVFMSLLTVIDNKQQDIPLIAVLYSEIFGFSIEQLIEIRTIDRDHSYYNAFKQYSLEGKNQGLKETCRETLEKLKNWKILSKAMPLDSYIWRLMLESDYYIAVGALPGGEQRQANLRAMVDKALHFANNQQNSLSAFLKYMEVIKEKKVPMGQVKLVGENENLVRIMTVHKSKGLEFPMVIVAGMGKGQNYSKIGKGVAFNKDIGIGLAMVDKNMHTYRSNIIQRAVQRKERKDGLAEEIRILYVALTRAKDKLYLLGTSRGLEKIYNRMDRYIINKSTYIGMVSPVMAMEGYPVVMHEQEQLEDIILGRRKDIKRAISLFDNENHVDDPEIVKEVERRMSYVYPFEKALNIKRKYSVTEINKMETEEKYPYQARIPNFCIEKGKFTAAEKGTIYHFVMSKLDFVKTSEEGLPAINEKIREMIDRGLLSEEEAATVNVDKLMNFFKTDIGKRATQSAKAGQLFRETPFNLSMEKFGEKVLVQGIIDCFFIEENQIVLIDYKTNYVDDSKDIEEEKARIMEYYQPQIRTYLEALEKIKGLKVKEAYLYLQGTGDAISMI